MNLQLMRKTLQGAVSQANSPHVGLWLSRGWNEFSQDEHGSKGGHLDKACEQTPSPLYKLAYERWKQLTADTARFRSLYMQLPQRLFIGFSTASAIETGVCTSHSYGMPMIPGSSVKGAVRAHATAIGVPVEYLAALFGEDETTAAAAKRVPGAGSLVWHDAWWIPDSAPRPFVRDVVTVHHQQYYAGKGEATDFDSPIPNVQIAVGGGFHFVVEGDAAWTDLALKLLQKALTESGIGAKRAAGYGFMEVDQKAMDKAKKAQNEVLIQALDPAGKVRFQLSDLSEKKLAEKFGKGFNATKGEYSEAEWVLVPKIGLELHGELIRSWSKETKKTNKAKAYKFFMGLKGED